MNNVSPFRQKKNEINIVMSLRYLLLEANRHDCEKLCCILKVALEIIGHDNKDDAMDSFNNFDEVKAVMDFLIRYENAPMAVKKDVLTILSHDPEKLN